MVGKRKAGKMMKWEKPGTAISRTNSDRFANKHEMFDVKLEEKYGEYIEKIFKT